MVRVANEYLACACRVQQDNPKKNMSADRYERYKAARTLQQVLDLGGSRGDIANDMLRGYIVVEDREMPLVITPARRVKVDIFKPPHPSQGVQGSLDEGLPSRIAVHPPQDQHRLRRLRFLVWCANLGTR